MGAWTFVSEMIEEVAQEIGCSEPLLRYAGRPTAASPASGFLKQHRNEQALLLEAALTIGLEHEGRIGSRKAKARRAQTPR